MTFAKQVGIFAVTIGGVIIGHTLVRSLLGGGRRNRHQENQNKNYNQNNQNFNNNNYSDTNNNQSNNSLNGLKNRKIFD